MKGKALIALFMLLICSVGFAVEITNFTVREISDWEYYLNVMFGGQAGTIVNQQASYKPSDKICQYFYSSPCVQVGGIFYPATVL